MQFQSVTEKGKCIDVFRTLMHVLKYKMLKYGLQEEPEHSFWGGFNIWWKMQIDIYADDGKENQVQLLCTRSELVQSSMVCKHTFLVHF